jgi:hypothetical protein
VLPLAGLLATAGLPAERAKVQRHGAVLGGLRVPGLARPAVVFAAVTLATGVLVTFLPLAMPSIQLNGRVILGCRDLGLDGIRGLREVTHRGGGTVMLYEGATPLRLATREEAATIPVFSTWGLKVISVLAERLFVKRQPLAR